MTFSTGLSALRANQTALSVVGHNIANASTEGYRRQEVIFAERDSIDYGHYSIGTGVTIADIRSAEANAIEGAIVESLSKSASLASTLGASRRLESLFLPGTGTVQERLEEFFLSLDRLSANPTEATLRSGAVRAAEDLANELNRISDELDQITAGVEVEIAATIEEINKTAKSIAELNAQIIDQQNVSKDAADLINQRDQLVKDLAQLIDVEKQITADGEQRFLMGGGLFSMESGLENASLVRGENGELEIWVEGCDEPHKITGGKLAALLSQTDGDNQRGSVGFVRQQLNEFTAALALNLDGAHATGLGIGGGLTNVTGGRPVEDPSASLSSQETISSISSGSLYISINEPNGETSVARVDIDPATQSLEDVAATIDALDMLSAQVSPKGELSIDADDGHTFGFTGNLATGPHDAGLSGTSQPRTGGRVHGTENEDWTFRFLGSGTVGVTDGLQLEVIDSNNITRKIVSIGTDYEPSSSILIDRGVELSLSSGTVVQGEEFELQVVGTPDESGILAALGISTLFHGDSAATLKVNPTIENNPSLLATTTNEEPSDTRNLLRMMAVRDAGVLRNGTVTLEQFMSDLVGGLGNETAQLERDLAGHEEHAAFLDRELQASVGVDVNEELARMLQYQRSYQAAARYIRSIDEMLQELFNIVG